jgi:glycosyltransferase involved in cell wall biosynthesis
MNPKVTIIIPHHNLHEYLPDAIKSARDQTYPCHICIIDDKSDEEDTTARIIKEQLGAPEQQEFGNDISRWRHKNYTLLFLHKGPFGPSYARNRGIEGLWENTDIFANLDADDQMMPNKIAECVKVISHAPQEIGVVYADHDTYNTTTRQTHREFREPFDLGRLRQECIVHSGAVINKMALAATKENTGFYDETMRTCEDFDLWMRIAEKFMIVHIPLALTLVQIQPKNSTDTVAKEIWNRNWLRIQQKLQQRHGGK